MVIFSAVRWKNFLSTGNTFTEIVLNGARSTILVGKSGSGKSTLLDAISFGLYNKPFRNINKNQLVNSINQKECLVEVEFSIGSKNYLVRRGIKPNIFEIYVDSVLLNQDSHTRDYQEVLEKSILKFNFKTFSQIVVLGASNFVPFMQLKPNDRRVIIESLLDIEIFSVMNVVLKQNLTTIKSSIQEVDQQIYFETSKKKIQEDHLHDLSKMKSDKLKENEELIHKNKKQIETINETNQSLHEQILALGIDKNKKTEITKNLDKIKKPSDRVSDSILKCKAEIEFYEKQQTCSTCKQTITEEMRRREIDAILNKIAEFQSALKKSEDAAAKLNSQLKEIEQLEFQSNDIQNKITKNKNTIYAIEQFIDKVESELEKLKSKQDDQEKYVNLLRDISDNITRLESQKESLLYDKDLSDSAISLLKDDGVKAKIIKQYLPLINKHTNLYLNSMNFFVSFNMDEEFNECIKSRGRDIFSYENFSEGEKQRIDLALLLTWRTIAKMKNSINTNLLIMDEVLDSYLDNAATENVLQLLNSDIFSSTNIFVISHKETISDKFNSVIGFTKNKNFSTVT
ncbi:MAG: AAA family ATPase [Bacteroidota bacterium]